MYTRFIMVHSWPLFQKSLDSRKKKSRPRQRSTHTKPSQVTNMSPCDSETSAAPVCLHFFGVARLSSLRPHATSRMGFRASIPPQDERLLSWMVQVGRVLSMGRTGIDAQNQWISMVKGHHKVLLGRKKWRSLPKA